MAIDLNDLLNKQNNPDNTALQDYGPEYVITADEWVKTVQAIQQNQNSVKKVSYNSREYLQDEEGLVTIIDASEGDVIFSAIISLMMIILRIEGFSQWKKIKILQRILFLQ